MSLRQYSLLCQKWEEEPRHELFAQIVAGADVLSISQREMAREFEVAESTISRWAKGYARPHIRVQRYIVGKLKKRADRAVKAAERQVLERVLENAA